MTVKSYRDLIVWQKAIALADSIYALTRQFPKEELYGLSNQMRRAAVSIASNIAEGSVRGTKEFIQFLVIARGSLAELETQSVVAKNQRYMNDAHYTSLVQCTEELSRMLMRFVLSLKKL